MMVTCPQPASDARQSVSESQICWRTAKVPLSALGNQPLRPKVQKNPQLLHLLTGSRRSPSRSAALMAQDLLNFSTNAPAPRTGGKADG